MACRAGAAAPGRDADQPALGSRPLRAGDNERCRGAAQRLWHPDLTGRGWQCRLRPIFALPHNLDPQLPWKQLRGNNCLETILEQLLGNNIGRSRYLRRILWPRWAVVRRPTEEGNVHGQHRRVYLLRLSAFCFATLGSLTCALLGSVLGLRFLFDQRDMAWLLTGAGMTRWTNGRFKHVVHRVPNPPPVRCLLSIFTLLIHYTYIKLNFNNA